MIKKCKFCDREFKTIPSVVRLGKGVYCSPTCQYKGIHIHRSKEIICLVCKKCIRVPNCSTKIFCSNVCRLKKQENPFKEFLCKWCNKKCKYEDYNFSRKTKFCSRKCSFLHKRVAYSGENSHRWEGGKTALTVLLRGSALYSDWRKSVFERDNFTCVICGARSYKNRGHTVVLNADHIKPFSRFPELRFDVSNGRTLCLECHKSTATFGSRMQNYI